MAVQLDNFLIKLQEIVSQNVHYNIGVTSTIDLANWHVLTDNMDMKVQQKELAIYHWMCYCLGFMGILNLKSLLRYVRLHQHYTLLIIF